MNHNEKGLGRVMMTAAIAVAIVSCAGAEEVQLRAETPGYGEVSKVTGLKRKKDYKAAEAVIATLQGQARDMAQFELWRGDDSKKDEIIATLKRAYESDPDSFWGWAAQGYLCDLGVEMPEREKHTERYLPEYSRYILTLPVKEADAKKKRSPVAAEDGDVLGLLRNRLLKVTGVEEVSDRVWNDEKILRDFFLSGELKDPARALAALELVVANDRRNWMATELGRRVGVAHALTATAKSTDEMIVRSVEAYRLFAEKKRLVPEAYSRTCREWRFVVPKIQRTADLLWLNAFGDAAMVRSRKACWKVPYRLRNCFGESIHGNKYMRPWRNSDWPSVRTRVAVGAVCGGLSGFGADIGNSWGVMTMTGGQPRHCAYCERTETGKWIKNYSINYPTTPHYRFWGGAFSYLQVMEESFKDQAKHDESILEVFRAEATGDEGHFRKAFEIAPWNYEAHLAYAGWLTAKDATDEKWRKYLRVMAKDVPFGRQGAWDIVYKGLDQMARHGDEAKALMSATAVEMVKLMPQPTEYEIGEEMNYTAVLNRLQKYFGGDRETLAKIFAAALESNVGRDRFFNAALAWGVEALKADEGDGCGFATVLEKVKKTTPEVKLDWRAMFGKAIKTKDRVMFRQTAELKDRLEPLRPKQGGDLEIKKEDYGGEIVSGEALVWMSSGHRENHPEDYGRFADGSYVPKEKEHIVFTGRSKEPFVTIELPGKADIYGVTVYASSSGRKNRHELLFPLSVSVSEDGKAWKEVKTIDKGGDEIRFDLRKDAVTSQYVRIGRKKDAMNESLIIRKAVVYGKTLY